MRKIKRNVLIVIVIMLISQNILQQYIGAFKYLDEFVAYGLGFISLIVLVISKKKSLTIYEKIIIIIIIIFGLMGIWMQVNNSIQYFKYALIDFIVFFKCMFAYLAIRILFKRIDYNKLFASLTMIVKILTVIIFSIYIINYIFELYPLVEIKFGIKVYDIMFGHVTHQVAFCVCNIALLKMNTFESNKIDKYIVLNLILIALTLRSKGILFIIIYIYIFGIRKNKKISIAEILASVICVLVSFKQVFMSKMVEGYARSVLTRYSFIIAKDFFPFGSGFGTFASNISGEYYSDVYYYYWINNTYGLSEVNHSFISDTFWPMVLGETGVIGLILYVTIILMLIINVLKMKTNVNKKYVILIPISYLLISSLGESAFVNYFGVTLMVIMGLGINKVISEEENKVCKI